MIPTLLRPMLALALIIMMSCSDNTRSTQSSNNGTLDVESTDSYRVDTSSAPDSASLSDTLNPPDASSSTDTTVNDTSGPPADSLWPSPQVGIHEESTRYLVAANENAAPMELMNSPRPPFGVWYATPFNTRMTALTAQINSNHAYSQLQAFSLKSDFILLTEDVPGTPSALHVVRRTEDFSELLSTPLGTWGNPRWDPSNNTKLIHFNNPNAGPNSLRLERTDVLTGDTETAFTFPTEYQAYLTNQSFDELSRNGRWLAGQAVGVGAWSRIFTVDLESQTLGAELDPEALYSSVCTPDPDWGAVDPDWVGVSPLGKYLMVQWATDGTGRCEGLESYDIQTGEYIGHVTSGHPHADLTVLADGVTEVFVTNELSGPDETSAWVGGADVQPIDSENPALAYRVLPGPAVGESPPQYLYLIDWGGFEHISCRGPIGTCLVTGYPSPENGARDPLEDEIYMINLDGSGVVRLAHHHSTGLDYWSQPRATISLDGRYVVFDTDWDLQNETLAFLIDLAETP